MTCVKPFSLNELQARVRALLRRGQQGGIPPMIVYGGLGFDTVSRTASVNGRALSLSTHETDVLEALLHRFGRVVSKDRLVEQLYDARDFARGHVEVPNRRHVVERFPLMSLTIALVSTDRMPVSHLAELIDVAQELKTHGKGIPGSVLVGERRTRAENGPGGDSKQVA